MSISFNQVVIAGNITRDPEMRHTNGGVPVCELTVALNYKRRVGDETQDTVTFVDVVCWQWNAERAVKHLRTGDGVIIGGRLNQERWERDGVPQSRLKVVCERLQMVNRNRLDSEAENQDASPIDPEGGD